MPGGNAHRILHTIYDAPRIIPDPGASNTITIDRQEGVCPVVTAAAEARTLRQPTKAGIVGTVVLDTDGGDLTLTVTGGYNADSDTTITFGDAGDYVRFVSIEVGSSYYWRVVSQEGTNVASESGTFDSLTVNGTANLTVTTLTVNGTTVVLSGLATEAGSGIDGIAATYASRVEKIGAVYKTTILIDLTGLRSTAAGDIIGDDGTSNPCHIGQITAAINGTIFAGSITCLETPAGGDPDLDLYSATEATGTEDDAITGLTETQLINSGDHAVNAFKSLTAFPAANEYLYLVAGATTDADYTAGILLIELYGK